MTSPDRIKGLTIALHHGQNQRLALEAHIRDEEEDEKPKKTASFRRVLVQPTMNG